MKKNILAENMRRFGTKNLNESYDLELELYDDWEKVPESPYNDGDLIVAEKDGKYYSATGIYSGKNLDYVNDIEEISKDEFESLINPWKSRGNQPR